MRWILISGGLALLVACSGTEDGDGPPHACLGFAVRVEVDTASVGETIETLTASTSTSLCYRGSPGVIECLPQSSSGDACTEIELSDAEALEAEVRQLFETSQPELLTDQSPGLETCPCRVY